jgi:hypothetical protein
MGNNKHQNKPQNLKGGNSSEEIVLTEKKEPLVYESSATGVAVKLLNAIKYIWTYTKFYVGNHKMEVGFLLGLLAYIITIIIVFTTNPYDIITENNGGVSIFLSLLGGFLILMLFFFYQQKKQSVENTEQTTALSYLGKIITSFVSVVLIIGIVYLLFTMSAYYNDFSAYFLFGLNTLIVIGLITLAVKYFGIHSEEPGEQKPTRFKLVIKTFTYIPRLLLDLTDYIKKQYQLTTKPIIIVFIAELILISIYLMYPWLSKQILNHNSTQLLNEPTVLTKEGNLGTFREINFLNDKFQYNYAVSGWLYINSFPPETNSNYNKYTSLLNIGNKPNILFNVAKNKLRIVMETEGKIKKILYETTGFKMQQWNNIVVNYDGATLDIFINNELLSSAPGIIPYNKNTMITYGATDGIHGGICNVNYYKEHITRGKINWAYNSAKVFNPPII